MTKALFTTLGPLTKDKLDIIEAEGGDPRRFISIHSQAEEDFALNHAVAARGAWIEYDNIGWVEDEVLLPRVLGMLEAGRGTQMLLSHDMGWYDPALPNGGVPKPYTRLSEMFLPKLRAAGVDEGTIVQLTHDNPFEAFARPI